MLARFISTRLFFSETPPTHIQYCQRFVKLSIQFVQLGTNLRHKIKTAQSVIKCLAVRIIRGKATSEARDKMYVAGLPERSDD